MSSWFVGPDGSILDETGKVLHFSVERFRDDICIRGCCFICGARSDQKPFNDEHVLPEWLLRRFDLFDKRVTLPNNTTIRYDRWTVPCCAACNSLMGEVVETPISKVVSGGAESINDFIRSGEALKLYVWIGLIFIKTHLRDKGFRMVLDHRAEDARIGDLYEWEQLHHIHSVCRCFYNDAEVDPKAIGSMLAIPVKSPAMAEAFDYADLFWPQTVCIRLGDVALIAVLNDSGGANGLIWNTLERITGPLNELQLRELMAEFAFLNMHLKIRPQFHTRPDPSTGRLFIEVTRPPRPELDELDYGIRGELLHYSIREQLPRLAVAGLSSGELEAAVMGGRFTFLFDDKGRFIVDAIHPVGSQ